LGGPDAIVQRDIPKSATKAIFIKELVMNFAWEIIEMRSKTKKIGE
jgi:hypothetical protein